MQKRIEAPDEARAGQERSRLIDHFKRAYQIIVGLAITSACGKLLPEGLASLWTLPFWQFCTFFITIVPIFHGGDRSLDVKYLGARPEGVQRVSYVWDVYMLLITALFFVKISQAIPGSSILCATPSPSTPEDFYYWIAAMLFFDVFVLVVDWAKNAALRTQGMPALRAYWPWLLLNTSLGMVCYWAAGSLRPVALSPETVGFVVFVLAFARTVLDYLFGQEFMFP